MDKRILTATLALFTLFLSPPTTTANTDDNVIIVDIDKNPQPVEQSPPGSSDVRTSSCSVVGLCDINPIWLLSHTEVNDDYYKRPNYWTTKSQRGSSVRTKSRRRGDSDKKEVCNYGRVPLNWDFCADRARPLPFSDEGTYGGGARSTSGIEAQVPNYGIVVTGASTPHVSTRGNQAQVLSNGNNVNEASIPHVSTGGNEAQGQSNETDVTGASTPHETARGNEFQVPSNESYINGTSTAHTSPSRMRLSKRKQSARVTEKKIGCSGWF